MLEHNLLSVILLCLIAALAVVIFVLKILYNKKHHIRKVLPFAGLAILFCGAICSIVIKFNTLMLMALFIALVCDFVQFLIDNIKSKNENKVKKQDVAKVAENNSMFNDDFFTENNITFDENGISDEIVKVGRNFFVKAADCLAEESNMNTLLEHINNGVIENTDSDGGMILFLDDFENTLDVKIITGDFVIPFKLDDDIPHKKERILAHFKNAKVSFEDNIFSRVINTSKPELISDASSDTRVANNGEEDFLKASSYILLPLIIKDSVIGIIALSKNVDSLPFDNDDFEKAKQLAHFASSAINCVISFNEIHEKEVMFKDFDVAENMRRKFIATKMPNIPTISLGSFFTEAKGICGDYIDIIPSRKDRISFIIADIAGKGMNSFVVMIMIRAIFRLIVNTNQSTSKILEWANRGIYSEKNIEHFASLALINYDSIKKKVQFSTAGTTPVYYFDGILNEFSKVSTLSEPIGVEKDSVYTDVELEVNKGDMIVTFTDGLVETLDENGNAYTAQRLLSFIKERKNLTGKEIAESVKKDVKNFMGDSIQHDDQTILVIKID